MKVTTLLGRVDEVEKTKATAAEVDEKRKETEEQRQEVAALKEVRLLLCVQCQSVAVTRQ